MVTSTFSVSIIITSCSNSPQSGDLPSFVGALAFQRWLNGACISDRVVGLDNARQRNAQF